MNDGWETAIAQTGLSASRKIVLGALVRLTGGKGDAVLAVDAICREAGTPARTVHRALNDLEDLALVRRRRGRVDGRRDGVIRGPSAFTVDLVALRRLARVLREDLRERLDRAYAVMALRRAKLQQNIGRMAGALRSATLARSLECSAYPFLNGAPGADPDAVALAPIGSAWEERQALRAMYVPVHLRAGRG